MIRSLLGVSLAALCLAFHAHAQAARWTLLLELRIGSVDDPDLALTPGIRVAVGPDGHVYVTEQMEHRVRVFGRDGRPLRSFGRKGRGPGEFDALTAVGFLGDTVYASDFRLRRMSFFRQDGSFLHSLRLSSPPSGPYAAATPLHLLADGSALVQPLVPVGAIESGEVTRVPLLRIDRGGSVLDTVAWKPTRPNPAVSIGTSRLHLPSPFSDVPLHAVSSSGQYVALVERPGAPDRSPAHFRVTLLSASGDTLYSHRYRYTPRTPDEAVVDSVAARIAEALARSPAIDARGAEHAIRAGIEVPDLLPPITAAAVADDGSVWLRREEGRGARQTWNVLAPDGTVRALVTAPKGVQVQDVRGDEVWAVETDALDVPYVVRYRVRDASR